MNRLFRATIFLPFLIFLSFFTSAFGANEEGDSLKRYEIFFGEAAQLGMIGPQTKDVVFTLRTQEGKIPTTGPKLEIMSASKTIVIESDANGHIKIPFSIDLLKENPPVRKLYDEVLQFELFLTVHAGQKSKQTREFSLKDKPYVEFEELRVWYPPSYRKKTGTVITELKKQSEFIEKHLGIKPIPWGINLIEERDPDVNIITLQEFPKWAVWTYSFEEMKQEKYIQTNIHEWVEQTLIRRFDLFDADPKGRNRFVLDGLADYIKIKYLGKIPNGYCKPLEMLIQQGTTQANLIQKFRSIRKLDYANGKKSMAERVQDESWIPGYPLSFAFWEKLCRQHGRILPKRFLNKIENEPQRDLDSCISILEELTNTKTIQSRLEVMNVAASLQLIKGFQKNH